jgi:flavin reductase (DIM6/NTAB) family NADH-FMN oxidoreductase RutF
MNKIKIGGRGPIPVMPIVLVGTNVNKKPNYMAVGFAGGINVNPPVVVVSLNKNHHTPKGIIENGTFSMNIPSKELVVETDYCGLVSGKKADKSKIFTSFYGELETAPMIEECPITCECKFLQSVEFEMDIAYFGQVHQVYVNQDLMDGKKIDMEKASPMVYSGFENKYRILGDSVGTAWKIGRSYTPKK